MQEIGPKRVDNNQTREDDETRRDTADSLKDILNVSQQWGSGALGVRLVDIKTTRAGEHPSHSVLASDIGYSL